jgi:acetoin utilization protein AcuB
MRLQEIMTRNVLVVPPQLAADEAYDRMRAARVRHLVVVENGELIGVLSDRDLRAVGGVAARRQRRVIELMTAHTVTATPATTVREAANLLRGHVIGCLPIVEKKKVVGILTTTDLLDLIGHGVGKRPGGKNWVLAGRGPGRSAEHARAPRPR